ncbi:hypothetical protein NKG94_50525 [Micromonospora sp. M12]
MNAQASGAFAVDVMLAGVSAAGRVTGQIRRLDGTAVGGAFSVAIPASATKATLTTTVPSPQQWSAETPNLYQVELSVTTSSGALLHSTVTRFGFRTIEVRSGDGIYVNGRKIVLKGPTGTPSGRPWAAPPARGWHGRTSH